MTVHVVTPPPLDAEAVPAPALVRQTSPQDWEQLVTNGHVMRERLKTGATRRFLLASGAAVAALVLAFAGPSILNFRIDPEWYVELQSNPFTYVRLQDGETLPYTAHFLADVPVQAGMSAAEFINLTDAVALDLAQHGADPTTWTETPKLARSPRITRPAKVFEADKLDALTTGVVAIPELREPTPDPISGVVRQGAVFAHVWAFVDGRLSWNALRIDYSRLNGGDVECRSLVGFSSGTQGAVSCLTGQTDYTAINANIGIFNPAAPAQAQE